MDILNGIFDGDDLAAALAVNQVHHVIQGSGFSRAGRARNENQPAGATRQLIDFGGQTEFFTVPNSVPAEADAHLRAGVAPVESGPDSSHNTVGKRNAKFPF